MEFFLEKILFVKIGAHFLVEILNTENKKKNV